MQEGLSLNLVLNGATLLSVLGLAVKVYLAGKAQKIEQPLEIKAASSSTPKEHCDERHKDIKEQLDNLFVERNENRAIVAGLKATVESQGKQLSSMDQKLDILLKRK